MDADVVVVGAGPTGLMLACELCLAGVRPLVLERQAQRRDTAQAGGLGGRILELLCHRGLLERCEAACTGPIPAPRFPFGGVHLDLTRLDDPPLHALPIPRQRLEEVLAGRAGELGEVFQEPLADEQPQRRLGALVAGTDIRYLMPGPSGHHPLAGAFVPDWAAAVDESPEDALPALREALTRWFGEPESDV